LSKNTMLYKQCFDAFIKTSPYVCLLKLALQQTFS
jgi:hypothetical protein